jgi:hypothetical protein
MTSRRLSCRSRGAAAAIYDRAIGLRLLHEDRDSGEEHYLIRYPAGTKGRVHRHTAAHTRWSSKDGSRPTTESLDQGPMHTSTEESR